MAVDPALKALAHPTRRAMLRLVWDAERSSSAIAGDLGLSRPATSQHLEVLRQPAWTTSASTAINACIASISNCLLRSERS